MNNEPNNNLNGTSLGSVNNPGVNPIPNPTNPTPENNIESLGLGDAINQNTINNNVTPESNPGVTPGTFFNASTLQEPTNTPNTQNSNVGVTPPVNNMDNNLNNVNPIPNPEPVQPTPAFTNPQSIGSGPIPGFENPNNIGTTPPISLEPEKTPKQKKKNSKLPFIIIVVFVLAAVGFGTYYVLNYTDLLNNNSVKTTIVTKELELSIGSALSDNITDYADINGTAPSNCSIDTSNIDNNKAGTYEFVITCGETRKSGTITVIDDRELEASLQKVYKSKNATLEAKEFAADPNDGLTYEFVDSASVEEILKGEAGTYTVKIKVSNDSKSKEFEGELVILEYEIKGYLTCNSNPQTIASIGASMSVGERFAIADKSATETNVYAGLAYEIHTFTFTDESKYADYLAEYNTNKTLTLNNITGTPTFDDEHKTITFTNERNSDEVVEEYGADVMSKYGTIMAHFRDTLGYTCTYNR